MYIKNSDDTYGVGMKKDEFEMMEWCLNIAQYNAASLKISNEKLELIKSMLKKCEESKNA